MVAYLIFKILPALAALLYTIYLTYVIYNPTRYKAVMRKHKKGTPSYEMYSKIYRPRFLIGSVCITLFLVFGVAYDFYRSTHTPSLFVVYFALAFTILISSVGFYLWSDSLKKKH